MKLRYTIWKLKFISKGFLQLYNNDVLAFIYLLTSIISGIFVAGLLVFLCVTGSLLWLMFLPYIFLQLISTIVVLSDKVEFWKEVDIYNLDYYDEWVTSREEIFELKNKISILKSLRNNKTI